MSFLELWLICRDSLSSQGRQWAYKAVCWLCAAFLLWSVLGPVSRGRHPLRVCVRAEARPSSLWRVNPVCLLRSVMTILIVPYRNPLIASPTRQRMLCQTLQLMVINELTHSWSQYCHVDIDSSSMMWWPVSGCRGQSVLYEGLLWWSAEKTNSDTCPHSGTHNAGIQDPYWTRHCNFGKKHNFFSTWEITTKTRRSQFRGKFYPKLPNRMLVTTVKS